MDYRKICEQIWEIERERDLFSKKIGGVYFWKIIRFSLVRRIAQEKNIFGLDHTEGSYTFLSKVKYALGILLNQRRTSAIYRREKRDILIFDHPRKVNVNGEYIDIYTYDFISKLDKDKYEVLERSYRGGHPNKVSENRSYEEYVSFSGIIRDRVFGLRLDKDERQYLTELEKQINSAFGTTIDIKGFVTGKINIFNWKKNNYDKLLKTRRPSVVYLVVSYVHEPLIAACRENHIETIEFQHGTMSKYHLGYSFPGYNAIPYFPDKMILFGKYWYDSTPLPVREDNVWYQGFPYLRDNLIEYRGCKQNTKTVLFISQGTIGKELSRIALRLARKTE